MLHIGIDEAGYGPLLGPLVIGLAAFRTDGAPPPLSRRLKGLVVRRPRDVRSQAKPLPVAIDDSKEIHRRFGRVGLARGVYAFHAARGESAPADLLDLLLRCSDTSPEAFSRHPWYRDLDRAGLPLCIAPPRLEDRFRRRGLEAVALRVRPLDARHLNEAFDTHDNKARVLGLAAGDTLLGLLERHGAEDARIVFDRQGARLDYAPYLADLFPFAAISERKAPEGEAHYEVRLPDRCLDIQFVTRGDRRALTVAWASMAAKLVRELFMDRLNAFFLERCPDVRPTRGYVQDGRRFLEDVDRVLLDEGIMARDLVRSR